MSSILILLLLASLKAGSPCHVETSNLNNYFNHTAAVELDLDLNSSTTKSLHILKTENLMKCGNITVTSVEYCYRTGSDYLDTPQGVFDLMLLSKSGNSFTVNKNIPVVTMPQNGTFCSPAVEGRHFICCVITPLAPSDHFTLPTNYSIGVQNSQPRNSLLVFVNESTFGTEDAEVVSGDTTVGATFQFVKNGTAGALVLRFRSEPIEPTNNESISVVEAVGITVAVVAVIALLIACLIVCVFIAKKVANPIVLIKERCRSEHHGLKKRREVEDDNYTPAPEIDGTLSRNALTSQTVKGNLETAISFQNAAFSESKEKEKNLDDSPTSDDYTKAEEVIMITTTEAKKTSEQNVVKSPTQSPIKIELKIVPAQKSLDAYNDVEDFVKVSTAIQKKVDSPTRKPDLKVDSEVARVPTPVLKAKSYGLAEKGQSTSETSNVKSLLKMMDAQKDKGLAEASSHDPKTSPNRSYGLFDWSNGPAEILAESSKNKSAESTSDASKVKALIKTMNGQNGQAEARASSPNPTTSPNRSYGLFEKTKSTPETAEVPKNKKLDPNQDYEVARAPTPLLNTTPNPSYSILELSTEKQTSEPTTDDLYEIVEAKSASAAKKEDEKKSEGIFQTLKRKISDLPGLQSGQSAAKKDEKPKSKSPNAAITKEEKPKSVIPSTTEKAKYRLSLQPENSIDDYVPVDKPPGAEKPQPTKASNGLIDAAKKRFSFQPGSSIDDYVPVEKPVITAKPNHLKPQSILEKVNEKTPQPVLQTEISIDTYEPVKKPAAAMKKDKSFEYDYVNPKKANYVSKTLPGTK